MALAPKLGPGELTALELPFVWYLPRYVGTVIGTSCTRYTPVVFRLLTTTIPSLGCSELTASEEPDLKPCVQTSSQAVATDHPWNEYNSIIVAPSVALAFYQTPSVVQSLEKPPQNTLLGLSIIRQIRVTVTRTSGSATASVSPGRVVHLPTNYVPT